MPANVMIDLETLSTANNALVLSIGAVKFLDGAIIDRFHVGIDPRSSQAYGLHIDADTVLWWMHEDRTNARNEMLKEVDGAAWDGDNIDLYSALDGFAQWYGTESLPTWGNGATFDNVILRNAFKATNIECPWKFWHDRCYRTAKAMCPYPEDEREGTHHNALDDATHQAKHLMKIWEPM